ncbi:MAG: hypothetical protein CMM37_01235 [Rhodospirillaceae bacterium]|nr:hypothetical protein [Rhodospirillaceae bacterium]
MVFGICRVAGEELVLSPNHDDGQIESIDSIDKEQAESATAEQNTVTCGNARAMKRVSPIVVNKYS